MFTVTCRCSLVIAGVPGDLQCSLVIAGVPSDLWCSWVIVGVHGDLLVFLNDC